MYVVSGVSSGWKISVVKVMTGGKAGWVEGKDIWKRRIAGTYGPRLPIEVSVRIQILAGRDECSLRTVAHEENPSP